MAIDYSVHYRRWHADTDEHYSRYAAFYASLLSPIIRDFDPSARILDVGCGMGILVAALRAQGFREVSGIDISAEQIEIARSRSLPCELVDETHIFRMAEHEPASLDAIFLLDVLEHMAPSSHLNWLASLHKLLKRGGRLILTVPNANSTFAARWRYIDWTHCTSFTEASLEFILINAGFGDIRFFPFEFGVRPAFPYVHRLGFWQIMLRKLVRAWRRLEALAELGREGASIPLGVNLLAVARRIE